MKKLILILHNIRSTYNVGAILRSAECFGVDEVVFSGYTPFFDKGLPHEQAKLRKQIHKTALGAEEQVTWSRSEIHNIIKKCQEQGIAVVALEQAKNSLNLADCGKLQNRDLALILGEEVHGIPPEILEQCDFCLEIPMFGHKESFNVSVATGIALWELRKNALGEGQEHLKSRS